MMRKGILRVLFVSGCLLFSAAKPAVAGSIFSEIVVFGDSLSDNGNLFFDSTNDPMLLPDPPSPPYFDGRQSNGIIWVEYLAQALGLPNPDPSTSGGSNYAYSGATSGFGDRLRSSIAYSGQTQLVPEIGKQITTYLSENVSFNDSQLIVEWSGANDLLEIIVEVLGGALDPTDPAAVASRFQETFVDVEAQLRLLDDNGAQHVLVPNQPDSSKAPFWSDPAFAPGAPVLSQFVNLYNASLSALVAGLDADPLFSAHLYEVDIYQAFNSLLENPDELGFTNTTDPALLVNSDGDGYVFWDVIHVTTDTHAAIADVMLANIPVPVPPTVALILSGMIGLVQFRRRFNLENAA